MLHIGLVFERTYSNWTNKSMFCIHFFSTTTTQIYELPEMEHHWNNLELNLILSHLWCMACNWTPLAFPKCKPAQIQPNPISPPNNLVTPCGCFVPATCPLVSVFHQDWALVQSRTLRNIFTSGLKMMIWRLFVFDVVTFLELSLIWSIV